MWGRLARSNCPSKAGAAVARSHLPALYFSSPKFDRWSTVTGCKGLSQFQEGLRMASHLGEVLRSSGGGLAFSPLPVPALIFFLPQIRRMEHSYRLQRP